MSIGYGGMIQFLKVCKLVVPGGKGGKHREFWENAPLVVMYQLAKI